eukprot:1493702-Amphidinium_carterae.1
MQQLLSCEQCQEVIQAPQTTLVANSIGSITALQAAIDDPGLFNGAAHVRQESSFTSTNQPQQSSECHPKVFLTSGSSVCARTPLLRQP